MKSFFTETLLSWHHAHPRPMPWSGEKDPYRIWLSEMMLQQTRVKQAKTELPCKPSFTRQFGFSLRLEVTQKR